MTEAFALTIHWIAVLLAVAAFVLATYFVQWGRGFGPFFMGASLNRRHISARQVLRDYHDEWALRSEVFVFLACAIFFRAGLLAWGGVWAILVATGQEAVADRTIDPVSPQTALKTAAFLIAGGVHLVRIRAISYRAPEYQAMAAAPEAEVVRLAITGQR